MNWGLIFFCSGVLLMCLTLAISNRELKSRVHKLDLKLSEHFNCHHRQNYDRIPTWMDSEGPPMWIDKYQPWPQPAKKEDWHEGLAAQMGRSSTQGCGG